MIDYENMCRICLEEGATWNIFVKNNDNESLQNKLILCFNEKIEDIAGYPRNICLVCVNIIQAICDFKTKYFNSCKILSGERLEHEVKAEDSSKDSEFEELFSLSDIKISKIEPHLKPSRDILQSLTEITIKRVKVENVLLIDDSNNSPDSNVNYTVENDYKNNVESQPKENENGEVRGSKSFGIKNKSKNNRKQKATWRRAGVKIVEEHATSEAKEKPPPTPRLCDICGQVFEKYKQMLSHKRTHPKKKHQCDKCPKVYKNKQTLNYHKIKIHDKIANFICDICGKAFYVKNHLINHVGVFHENKPRRKKVMNYKCKFCEKTFKYKKGRDIHERAVHTGERPAVCSVCDSAFYDVCYLKEHMRLHTGDVPFKCPICNRGYAQRCNMKSHMRNHKISELSPEVLNKLKPSYFKHLRP